MDLQEISTKKLVDELVKREGVDELIVDPYKGYCIAAGINDSSRDDTIQGQGPARILIVID